MVCSLVWGVCGKSPVIRLGLVMYSLICSVILT